MSQQLNRLVKIPDECINRSHWFTFWNFQCAKKRRLELERDPNLCRLSSYFSFCLHIFLFLWHNPYVTFENEINVQLKIYKRLHFSSCRFSSSSFYVFVVGVVWLCFFFFAFFSSAILSQLNVLYAFCIHIYRTHASLHTWHCTKRNQS